MGILTQLIIIGKKNNYKMGGIFVKNYIKPNLQYVKLAVEERFAGGGSCTNGACTDPAGKIIWLSPSA